MATPKPPRRALWLRALAGSGVALFAIAVYLAVQNTHLDTVTEEPQGTPLATEGQTTVPESEVTAPDMRVDAPHQGQGQPPAEAGSEASSTPAPAKQVTDAAPLLPAELDVTESTHHVLTGTARSDIGTVTFSARLHPDYQVELTLGLATPEKNDVKLDARVDLARFTMELDGHGQTLSPDHKKMLAALAEALKPRIIKQYENQDIPEHALVLVQLASYWSRSPANYVHEKRVIVSR